MKYKFTGDGYTSDEMNYFNNCQWLSNFSLKSEAFAWINEIESTLYGLKLI